MNLKAFFPWNPSHPLNLLVYYVSQSWRQVENFDWELNLNCHDRAFRHPLAVLARYRHVGPINISDHILKDGLFKRFRRQLSVPGQLFNGAA
jgi:hypothetical protein